jgi:hypothetical protein
MSTPEIIYLIPGEDIEGYPEMVWCESSAPSDHCDPDEAVKYVRADTLPRPMLPPFPPEGEGMPRYGLRWNGPTKPLSAPMDDGYWTPWHLASAENERLQERVAELESFINQAPVETGVCMCGEEMYRHSSQPNHTPMDSWDYERDSAQRCRQSAPLLIRSIECTRNR